MAIRLRSTYRSLSNVRYGLEIHDRELASDSLHTFRMRDSEGPTVSYAGNQLNIMHPIFAGSCSFNVMLENAFHTSFFEDYMTSPESRFLIRIYYIGIANQETTIFVGKLVHDIATIREEPTPVLNLTAVDPLAELQYVDYEGTDFRQRLTRCLLEFILNKSKTFNYFYPNEEDEVLHVYNQYRSVEHADVTDILNKTYLQNYFKEVKDGISKRRTCIYVLSEILKSLGSRIYFSGGKYVIEQIARREEASSVFSRYKKNGDFVGTGNITYEVNWNSTIMDADRYPEMTFIAPLKSVVLEQNGDVVNNILFGVQYTQDVIPPVQQLSTVTEVVENQKVYSRIVINPWVMKTDSYNANLPKFGYFKFHIRIQIGGRYLNGKSGILWQNNDQPLSIDLADTYWGGNATDRVEIFLPARIFYTQSQTQTNAADFVYTIDIISPLIEETGDVFFDLEFKGSYNNGDLNTPLSNDLPPFFDERYTADSNSIAILTNIKDANDNKGSTLTTLVNDLENTIIFNTRYDMGSFPETNDVHRLIVTNGSGEFVDSDQWVHPTAGNMLFQNLAITDIISLRRVARRRLLITFRMKGAFPVQVRSRFLYKGKTYVPLSYDLGTRSDTCTILFMEVGTNTANLSPPVILLPTILDTRGGIWDGPSSPSTSLQGETTPSGNRHYNQYIGVDDFILVDDYDELPDPAVFSEKSIQQSIQVFMGGTKQRFKNVPKNQLAQGEYRIDFVNKKFEWRRSIAGRTFEVYANNNYEVDPAAQVS